MMASKLERFEGNTLYFPVMAEQLRLPLYYRITVMGNHWQSHVISLKIPFKMYYAVWFEVGGVGRRDRWQNNDRSIVHESDLTLLESLWWILKGCVAATSISQQGSFSHYEQEEARIEILHQLHVRTLISLSTPSSITNGTNSQDRIMTYSWHLRRLLLFTPNIACNAQGEEDNNCSSRRAILIQHSVPALHSAVSHQLPKAK